MFSKSSHTTEFIMSMNDLSAIWLSNGLLVMASRLSKLVPNSLVIEKLLTID